MEAQAIVTRTAKIWFDADGILRITVLPGAHETLDDAKQVAGAVTQLSQGTPRLMLVDLRAIGSQSREARQYYAGQAVAGGVLAGAMLIGSSISRLVGNFFLSFGKPKTPSKLFTSEAAALDWLKGFLQ